MKRVFQELASLDENCYKTFGLSEEILMENAAFGLAKSIRKKLKKNSSILILCGPGNNGADGLVLARLLDEEYDVAFCLVAEPKSTLCKLQYQRVKTLHVKETQTLFKADCVVDCIFGSGLSKPLNETVLGFLKTINSYKSLKIACDIPTGINDRGQIQQDAFKADITVSMGAFKQSLLSDSAKEFVGKLKIASLGLNSKFYEKTSDVYILEKKDMKLPIREKADTHKGDYGHTCILGGQKSGASILSGIGAFNFGSGLVSIITKEIHGLPPYLMKSQHIPSNCSVVVAGMGLGEMEDELLYEYLLAHPKPLVIDADLFYQTIIIDLLEKKDKVVLTPHPKEFCALLKVCGLADISVQELQEDRMNYIRIFAQKYPDVVLLLKGANTIITYQKQFYINSFGTNKLSKGGSGDVLAGMIGSLIAQGYTLLDAAVSASLAHTLSAKKSKFANYALTPLDICEGIKWL